MASSAMDGALPAPEQLARGIAGAVPAELSKSPLLGILGAIMGAGIGQSFAFLGLVSSIILQRLFTGGISKPQWILTFSAYFHTIRLCGGNMGAVSIGHFIAQREKLHSNLLGLHVQAGNWITDGSLRQMTAGVFAVSSGLAAAAGILGGRIRLQAYTLSIIDGFYFVAWGCVIAMILVAHLRESPLKYGSIATYQQIPSRPEGVKE